MSDKHDSEPTQQTRPKKGEPITIPVPEKADVLDFLEKTAKLPDPERRSAMTPEEALKDT